MYVFAKLSPDSANLCTKAVDSSIHETSRKRLRIAEPTALTVLGVKIRSRGDAGKRERTALGGIWGACCEYQTFVNGNGGGAEQVVLDRDQTAAPTLYAVKKT